MMQHKKSMDSVMRRRKILEEAWIGDAVLSLYARLRILERDGLIDAAKFQRMTSNHFLAGTGEPSEVEAEIGRVYSREGLAAAFAWIDEKLTPLFDRQEARRLQPPHKTV